MINNIIFPKIGQKAYIRISDGSCFGSEIVKVKVVNVNFEKGNIVFFKRNYGYLEKSWYLTLSIDSEHIIGFYRESFLKRFIRFIFGL
jgi:hypothetical protein